MIALRRCENEVFLIVAFGGPFFPDANQFERMIRMLIELKRRVLVQKLNNNKNSFFANRTTVIVRVCGEIGIPIVC